MKFFLSYLDPNSGSIILQAIIGVFLAAGYFFRHTFGGLIARFRKSDAKPAADNSKKRTENSE